MLENWLNHMMAEHVASTASTAPIKGKGLNADPPTEAERMRFAAKQSKRAQMVFAMAFNEVVRQVRGQNISVSEMPR